MLEPSVYIQLSGINFGVHGYGVGGPSCGDGAPTPFPGRGGKATVGGSCWDDVYPSFDVSGVFEWIWEGVFKVMRDETPLVCPCGGVWGPVVVRVEFSAGR